MIKIVYFDNLSAIDYINIYNGGNVSVEKQTLDKQADEIVIKAGAKMAAKFSWLPFFGVDAEAGLDAKIDKDTNILMKKTISNTILTDFIEKTITDDKIEKLEGFKLYPYKNSITFFKIFTPYLKMIKSDIVSGDITIDISKMDESFKDGKGYYELIAEKNEGENKEKYVFRFNISSFRNGYMMSDLMKMDLKYFAIKVGKVKEEMLNIDKEINMGDNGIYTLSDMKDENYLEVYDVILAGVEV